VPLEHGIYIRLMSTKQISKKNNNKYEQSRGQRMLTHTLNSIDLPDKLL